MKIRMYTLFIAAIAVSNSFTSKINAITEDSVRWHTHTSVSPKTFQVSFIPFFGTNGFESAEYINNVSFNILAGYNGGTSGFELGGLVNIDRYDVEATQIAGIGNHVGGETKGVQMAGIYNITRITTGTQLAGITNIASEMNGVQVAGISNHAIRGKSVQIGGLVNLTEDRALFQAAGLTNHARTSEGTQIAGLVNTAQTAKGSQIAGIVNIAGNIKGVQIGLINIADTIGGVPIGLFNFIKKGYRKLEFSADEFFLTNITYRSGVEKFHTLITFGIQPHRIGSPLWTNGVGAGTSQVISPKTLLDFDATFQHIIKRDDMGNNYLYRIYLGVDRTLSARVSLAIGFTYNFLVTDIRSNTNAEYYSDIAPYSFSDHDYNSFNLKSWAGIKAGIRFR